ncbi:hypothetical protein RJ640_003657, partial [Escallonia rubra]
MDVGISHTTETEKQEITDCSIQSGPPPEAMFFALAYLPLFELLSMGQVCRSLRDAVNNDILPWLTIMVKRPLNSRITDDFLMKITARGNGRLRSLALVNCFKITDDGLHSVIAQNPHLNKLYIPGCTGLTPEGVIRAAKMITERNHNVLTLKINGIYNINEEHLKTLRSLLGINQTREQQQQKQWQTVYMHEYKRFSNFRGEETGCSIDMDICPKCNEARMVFDCPREQCEREWCRGCYLCIPRCEECGRCVELEEQSDAACKEILCLDCWFQLPKCNFCNKPYCNQHAFQQCSLPDSSGFLCDVCHAKFIRLVQSRLH